MKHMTENLTLALALVLMGGCGSNNVGGNDNNYNQPGPDGGGHDATVGDDAATPDAQTGDCTSSTQGEPGQPNPAAGQTGHTVAGFWKYNRLSALTISFDDSTPGQANHGVPAMNARGLTGTWFVNPGADAYLAYSNVWEVDAVNGGQELANHSMHHSGAANYAEAEDEIGDAAAVIWATYPPERSPLHGFNNGGGTNWNITEAEYDALLAQFYCVEREHSYGVPSATLAAVLFPQVRDRLMLAYGDGGWFDRWGLLHFHGLCDPVINDNGHCICTPGNPCEEYGEGVLSGAVELGEFTDFLDGLISDPWVTDNVWIAGFIAAHKYQQLRNDVTYLYIPVGTDELAVRLESSLDPALYDEELTLLTTVPGSWSTCVAVQCGVVLDCEVVDGNAVYEVRLGRGDIALTET